MAVASEMKIPSHLKSKISPGMLYFLGIRGIFFRIMFIALAGLLLHIVSDPNGFTYVAGAFLCPIAIAVFLSFVPLKPYRGTLYVEKVHDVDRSVPAVMRLVELLKSNEARRHIWLQSAILSPVLFLVGLGFREGQPATWSLSLSALHFQCGICLVMCFVSCLTLLGGDLTAWAVKTWASREPTQVPNP